MEIKNLSNVLLRKKTLQQIAEIAGDDCPVTFDTTGKVDVEQTETNVERFAGSLKGLPSRVKDTSFPVSSLMDQWPVVEIISPLSGQALPNGEDLDLEIDFGKWDDQELILVWLIAKEHDALSGWQKKFGGDTAKSRLRNINRADDRVKKMAEIVGGHTSPIMQYFRERQQPGHPDGPFPDFRSIRWPRANASFGRPRTGGGGNTDSIQRMIANGDLKEALDAMAELVARSGNKKNIQMVVTLSARYNQLQRRRISGLITDSEERVTTNQICESVLETLFKL